MELLIIELLGRWKMKKLTVRVEDYMHAKDVVDTINNEYGKTMNV